MAIDELEFDWDRYVAENLISCDKCGNEFSPKEALIERKAFHLDGEQYLLEYMACERCDAVYPINVESMDTLRVLQTLQEARSLLQAAIQQGKGERKVKRLHKASKKAYRARSKAFLDLQERFKEWKSAVRTRADVAALR